METWFEDGTSWKARCGALEAGFEDATPLVEEEGTAPESEPPKVGCMRFFGLRFAMSVLICSPPFRTVAGVALPKSWPCVRGDGGGVMRWLAWAFAASAAIWWENPSGKGGAVNPNRLRYCSWAEEGAMPSNSLTSKLNTAMVPSDETAYSVRPSVDLRMLIRSSLSS